MRVTGVRDDGYHLIDAEMVALTFIAPLMMWRQLLSISPNHVWVEKPRDFARHCVDQFLHGAAATPE